MKITINSLVLDGEAYATGDSDGDVFAADFLEGFDLQQIEVSTKDRAGGGVCVTKVVMKGYSMTLQGHAFTRQARNNQRLRNKLATAFNLPSSATMRVEFPYVTGVTMTVYRDGDMRVDLNGPNVIKFEIPLLAPDGVKTPYP